MWPLNKIKQLRRNNNISEGNIIKKRPYYTGQLPKEKKFESNEKFKSLNLDGNQLKHPLIIDINVERREFNVTNATHSKYFKGNKLEYIGIDKDGRNSYILPFNPTLKIDKNNIVKIEKLMIEIEDKKIVKDEGFLSMKLTEQAKNDGVMIDNTNKLKSDLLNLFDLKD